MQVTVIIGNEFASQTTLTLKDENGNLLTAAEIVLFYLPYIKEQSAWSVVRNQDAKCCILSRYNVSVTVDFSDLSDLSALPDCPQEWLDNLIAKCMIVHNAFTSQHSPSFVSVTRTITPFI